MFTPVKKGARPSPVSIYIAETSKTINFSVGFFRTYGINLEKINFLRLAYDPSTKEIAIEFLENGEDNDECLKLTFPQPKTSASSSINPILGTFSLNIKEVAGTYKDKALAGPIKINGFSDNGFILSTTHREV